MSGVAEVTAPGAGTFTVYDRDGGCVGRVCRETGRALIAGSFWAVERTARAEVSHGLHGPEPRFDGDVWTMHHVCSECGGPIDGEDAFCKNCGARIVKGES